MIRKSSNRWTLKEQALYLNRLGELLDQGYMFEQASQFLLLQLPKNRCKDIETIIESCKQGDSLYTAFGKVSFHKDILGYLYFAEQHGDISFALREGSIMLQKKLVQIEKTKKLIRYPVFLLLFVSFMFTMIEKILLPQFEQLYTSMNYQKNFLSILLMNLPLLNRVVILAFMTLIIVGTICYFLRIKTLPVKQQMNLLLKIPFLNHISILYHSHFFAVQLSNLLKGGLSILESLTMFEQQQHSPFFREEAREMKQLLLAGNRFEEIIEGRQFYENELSLIIAHGQSNGNLAKELHHYGQFVMARLEEKITKLLAVIQPLLFTCIGAIIMLMYAAIMVPMFQLLNGI
ncbi:competence type IV pilus assembly protein ComGB [Fredinandcohnia sp. 179-A 10B2 NHS]|uniref:competence type IV pilus assembly protein ComGB n=1 Tax=Fredinandcohnia sp. 179-A 10B2 NHS TaxID=3235176 RepID=UPI0039A35183